MNFNDHYPLVDIEGNRAFANNGNIILGYRLELPEIYSLSEKDFGRPIVTSRGGNTFPIRLISSLSGPEPGDCTGPNISIRSSWSQGR